MKNKWLVIIFIFFLGVIILSLWITQQTQKAVILAEKEILGIQQAENRVAPTYSSRVTSASVARLPFRKSGITIIKSPATELREKSISVPKLADKSENKVSGQSIVSGLSGAASVEIQAGPQTGITKIGKQPTPKEAQEMNSSGIVLY